jgi:uncharacterized protein (TIGR04255 family)
MGRSCRVLRWKVDVRCEFVITHNHTMNRSLPDFENPPLVEVALSVQFDTLTSLRTPQVGMLWAELRSRFPKTEEHRPLNPVIERFGIPKTTTPEVRFEMIEVPPVPRIWFLNEAGTELIQIQQDRFIHNWRKVGEGDAYPRYERVRETFRSELVSFAATLSREQIGELKANQCEVTYVNHIVTGEGWQTHGELGNVLTVFNATYSDETLQEPESIRLALRYILRNGKDEPIGRLHVLVQPAYRRTDNQPMLVLTLTARGRPEGDQLDHVLGFLDRGREEIVRGFASITTPVMHRLWGRKDG